MIGEFEFVATCHGASQNGRSYFGKWLKNTKFAKINPLQNFLLYDRYLILIFTHGRTCSCSSILSNYLVCGSRDLVTKYPGLLDENQEITLCRKDTETSKRLRQWSRGYPFIISGGHNEMFSPLLYVSTLNLHCDFVYYV